MKILVIAGDHWHPMEVIQRGIQQMNLDPAIYQFDYVEDARDIVTKSLLDMQDVVIFAKANVIGSWNDKPMFQKDNMALTVADYRAYVEDGGALLSLHAGNTGDTSEWQHFVGNCFARHPARCEVSVYPIQEHAITQGVKKFSAIDEQYEMAWIAEDADIFLKSECEAGGIQVSGYTRQMGKGKVCVLLPGHTMHTWSHPAFERLFQNALDWCGR